MKSLTQKLVDFAVEQKYTVLPKDVIHESKRILLDSIGVALAGHSVEKGKVGVKVAMENGGPPEAKIIGTGDSVSMSSAAFANGELINALDFDCCGIPPGHVTPFMIPAMLAAGEKKRVSGKDLIAAIAIGHEVSARFGTAMAYYRDLKPGKQVGLPPVHGYSSTIFGGTLGAGLLSGLNPEKLTNALGIAGYIAPTQSMTKYSNALHAPPMKYLLAGWINQAELLAISLAENNTDGDPEVLEGEYGFWRFIGSTKWDPENLMKDLGNEWRFIGTTIFKPYPCCRIMHTVLDCFYQLIEENHLQPEEIEDVKTYADPNCAVLPVWANTDIFTHIDAQLSMPYSIAAAAHRVKIGPEWQDLGTMKDPKIKDFMNKVSIFPHPNFEEALKKDSGSRIGKVEVSARGKIFSEERMFRKGSPASPQTRMTDNELVEKFKHNAARVLTLDKVEKLPAMILNLDEIDDTSCLFEML